MVKSKLTRFCEKALWQEYAKHGVFGAFEVTIGPYGKEIVDFITYDFSGTVKCYEIKVSMSDYNSTANVSFLGDYNYYVITSELYNKLVDAESKRLSKFETFSEKEIKNAFKNKMQNRGIGVLVVTSSGHLCNEISAKRKYPKLPDKVLILESMVRSLNREVNKYYKEFPYWIEK